MELTWVAANALSGAVIAQLDPISWECSDPLTGAGSATLTLPAPRTRGQATRLRELTELDALTYALHDRVGRVLWAGVITSRGWRRREGQVTVTATDWRSWFYQRMRFATGYSATDVEQATVWSQLVNASLNHAGAPKMVLNPPLADGVLRTLYLPLYSVYGQVFDDLSRSDQGLEWWVEGTWADDKQRSIMLQVRVGTRGSGNVSPFLQSGPSGGNVLDYEWPEDGTERRTRIVALGEGIAPDQVWASDEHPDLAAGGVLLRESVSGPYAGVMKVSRAFALARSERAARSAAVQTVQLTVRADQPVVGAYATGDRVRLSLIDEWLDVDEAAVRLLDRSIRGGRAEPTTASLTLDMNDVEMPEGAG